jgi:hypothetical protein
VSPISRVRHAGYCRTTTFLNAHVHNPEDASTQWAEVTDPREPLFGKRLRVEFIARTDPQLAHVFLKRDDGIVLRVPLRATSLSTLVDPAPRATLSQQAVTEFLGLVKEYAPCRPTKKRRLKTSGRR